MGGQQVNYADLNQPQKNALIDIVARGGLYRIRAGYEGSLHQPHSHATIVALARFGLCSIRPNVGCMGTVEPTASGRKLIAAEFGSNTYGPAVMMVDASRKPRARR
jgi:hypothetical protein